MSDPRFPIGEFVAPGEISPAARCEVIESIAAHPASLRQAVAELGEEQLDTPYREGGWTVRQVCHHLPDSHLNAYIRFKLGLTQERPTIRTYEESLWSRLPDASDPIEDALTLLEALHVRWVALLRALAEESWGREVDHPDSGVLRLDTLAASYAWHGEHHVAHITTLRAQRGW